MLNELHRAINHTLQWRSSTPKAPSHKFIQSSHLITRPPTHRKADLQNTTSVSTACSRFASLQVTSKSQSIKSTPRLFKIPPSPGHLPLLPHPSDTLPIAEATYIVFVLLMVDYGFASQKSFQFLRVHPPRRAHHTDERVLLVSAGCGY
jgi:hypothetical protein